MKKILLTFILFALFLGCFSLPAFAESQEEGQQTPTMQDNEQSTAQDFPAANENASEESKDNPADTTLSGAVTDFFGEYADDICQYLSLLVSVLLAWLFKKGVLPSLSGSMGHISKTLDGGISALLEEGKTLSKNTEESIRQFVETVTPTLERLGETAENAKKTDMAVAEVKQELQNAEADRHRTQAVLLAQMELFYQFFMSVNLPQYQKDRLGESYTRLLALVEADHDTEA